MKGSLGLPGGDPAVVCTGGIDGTATFKKLPPALGSGVLAPGDGACTFEVLFDLPRKVARHKVGFAFSFPGNGYLGPLDFSRQLKVRKPKKP